MNQPNQITLADDLNRLTKLMTENFNNVKEEMEAIAYDNDVQTCWKCNEFLNPDNDICNVYDEHTYCNKCCAEVSKEYEAEGWKYDSETDTAYPPKD